MKKILFVASEVAPYAKSGGLGDVIGSLPKELIEMGYDVSVIMPAVHGYVPCMTGTSHGVDYYITDYYSGCISPARISAKLVIELLSNNAEKGRKIAAKKANMMSVDEYIRTIDEISGF